MRSRIICKDLKKKKQGSLHLKSNTIKYFLTEPNNNRLTKKLQDEIPIPVPAARQILTPIHSLDMLFPAQPPDQALGQTVGQTVGQNRPIIRKPVKNDTAADSSSIIGQSFFLTIQFFYQLLSESKNYCCRYWWPG